MLSISEKQIFETIIFMKRNPPEFIKISLRRANKNYDLRSDAESKCCISQAVSTTIKKFNKLLQNNKKGSLEERTISGAQLDVALSVKARSH